MRKKNNLFFSDVIMNIFNDSNYENVGELLLVDDFSSPENFDLLSQEVDRRNVEFGSKIRYVRLPFGDINGGNRGLARNFGASLAMHDTILFLDQDMVISDNFFKAALYYFEKEGDDIAITGLKFQNYNGHRTLESFVPKSTKIEVCNCDFADGGCANKCPQQIPSGVSMVNYYRDMIRKEDYSSFKLHNSVISIITYAMVVKKRVFLLTGGFDLRYSGWGMEDYEYGCRMAACGFRSMFCDHNLFCWHIEHERSIRAVDEWILNASIYLCKYGASELRISSHIKGLCAKFCVSSVFFKNRIIEFLESSIKGFGCENNFLKVDNDMWPIFEYSKFCRKTLASSKRVGLRRLDTGNILDKYPDTTDQYLRWHKHRIVTAAKILHKKIYRSDVGDICILEVNPEAKYFRDRMLDIDLGRKINVYELLKNEDFSEAKFVGNTVKEYDVVVSLNNIEASFSASGGRASYENVEKYFVNCIDLLRDGGILFLMCSNRISYKSIKGMIKKEIPLQWAPNVMQLGSRGHIQELSCADLSIVSERSGLLSNFDIWTENFSLHPTVMSAEELFIIDKFFSAEKKKKWLFDTIFFIGKKKKKNEAFYEG
jgi:hypothetical protein